MLSLLTAGALGGHFVTCGEPSPWQRVPETSLGAPLLSTVYLVVPVMLGVWEVSAYKSLGAERAAVCAGRLWRETRTRQEGSRQTRD